MNDACPECGAPRDDWPMAHRGDYTCSQLCEKAYNLANPPKKKAVKRARKRA